jgi:predicted O-methyltransferase YrrM
MSLAEWQRLAHDSDTLFLHSSVRADRGLRSRLQRALANPANGAVTCFYRQHRHGQDVTIAPLGGALDLGWYRNVFGGPCVLARASATAIIRDTATRGFDFWTAYAAIACSGVTLAVVPAPLYRCDASEATSSAQIDAVIREYHTRRPAALDLRWVLKGMYAAANGAQLTTASTPGAVGRSLYDRLVAIPDGELRGYAELDPSAVATDAHFRDFAAVRARLAPILARFAHSEPRVYIYGAGAHTRMLLAAVPALGRFVDGFIDRQRRGEFLGKPCIAPDEFRREMADVIVYSSREWEREMYERMQSLPVEHVLLYNDPVAPPAGDTVTRLQNRFGYAPPDAAPLATLLERRPSWLTGSISGGDCQFLFHIIQALAPARVLELGVASGCSTAGLLCALDQLPAVAGGRKLSSFDVLPHCYFDKQYATGAAAPIMYPNPRTDWSLDTNAMDARAIARAFAPGSFDFAFIDANHCHPWPLLDVLHLTTVLKPRSWIVLHDIELPNIHPQYPERGALLLFKHWPLAKIHGVGDSRNIGAVQLPADPAALTPMAKALLEYATQWPVHEAFMALPPAFAEIEQLLRGRLKTDANRPLSSLAAV